MSHRHRTLRLRRPATRLGGLVAASTVVLLLGAAPMPAGGTVELEGTLGAYIVEADHSVDGATSTTVPYATVDGFPVDLPADFSMAGVALGDAVALTVPVSAGDDRADAVAALVAREALVTAARAVPGPARGLAEGAVAPSVQGDHAVKVLPVYFGSAPSSPSQAEMATMGNGVRTYWQTQSANRIRFSSPVVGTWQKITPVTTNCYDGRFYGDVVAKAMTAHDINQDWVDAFHHVIVVMPEQSACYWSGLGDIGNGRILLNGNINVDTAAHEMGHNLGLGHAGTVECGNATITSDFLASCSIDEYGDEADVMGYGHYSDYPGTLNAAMADHLGLLTASDAPATGSITTSVQQITQYTAHRAVRAPYGDKTIYAEYRPVVTPDTYMAHWAGVQLRVVAPEPYWGYPESYILDLNPASDYNSPQLAPGASWTVPGTATAVRNLGQSATAATLQVGNPNTAPKGSLDAVTGSLTGLRVQGWALDLDTAASVDVHVYVDGKFARALTASGNRPDVGGAYGTSGKHGYDLTIPAAQGAHEVCVYAINVPTGPNPKLGCRTGTVTNALPKGSVDQASAGPGSLRVAGWALDPDTTSSIAVHVYVDGKFSRALTASGSRPDVGAAYGTSGKHGYDLTIPAAQGAHEVCVYAINAPTGPNPKLGCRTATVTNVAPVGALDSVTAASGGLRVSGWALDQDQPNTPLTVHVYVDGKAVRAVSAGNPRPDVGRYYGTAGNHGYSVTVPAAAGTHQVCTYAINLPTGANPQLGCRSATL